MQEFLITTVQTIAAYIIGHLLAMLIYWVANQPFIKKINVDKRTAHLFYLVFILYPAFYFFPQNVFVTFPILIILVEIFWKEKLRKLLQD